MNKEKKTFSKTFATIGDVGGMFISFVYILYVVMALYLDVGYRVVNYIMLGITIAYVLFYLFKIFVINKRNPKTRAKKITKFIYKYSKHAIKLIHASIVVLSIVNMRTDSASRSMVAIIGLIVIIVLFVVAIAWDICMHFIKRKIRELRTEWAQLDAEARKDKIDFFIDRIISGLDNVVDFEEYVEIGKKVGKHVGRRIDEKNNDKLLGDGVDNS